MTNTKINDELVKEFEDLANIYSLDDSTREQIISSSREILKLSKQAIYNLHREDFNQSKLLIEKASNEIVKTKKLIDGSSLKEIGSFRACLEEFVEAKGYLFFLENKKIPTRKNLNIPIEIHYDTYLLGLSDLSGELVRRCVTAATNDKTDEVKEINAILEELYGLWLKFDFRTSELRKKFDTLRYNLSKTNFLKLEIPYPDPEEQTAIATVLFDMDVEIEVLEKFLSKYRQIKIGMMQQLLTGKIRLIKK
jgi:predicted translin family RNA/ssDNA-binding protein